MKSLFVLNPTAGGKDHSELLAGIEALAADTALENKIYLTTGQEDDRHIRELLSSFQPERVIAGGGDGTLQLVARNLAGSQHLMGILPLGSANGMAKAIGIEEANLETVKALLGAEHFVRMDLLRFNHNHLCIHLGDIGVNALMVKKYGSENSKGMMGYARHVISSLQESPLLRYSIETPEGTYDREGYVLAFANANKYGTGVRISDGDFWDGKFEICNVPEITLKDAITAGLTMINVFSEKEVFSDVITCTRATVRVSPSAHFQIDGEYMGEVSSLSVEIVPGAVKLLLP